MPPMTSTLVSVGLFVVLLALIPVALKWVQRRTVGGGASVTSASKIISAIAVGPHQRVVTVEVGPEGARSWLTLGVTAQTITCLHSAALDSKRDGGSTSANEIQSVLL
jgi:flagellar protein FliO/FliZ